MSLGSGSSGGMKTVEHAQDVASAWAQAVLAHPWPSAGIDLPGDEPFLLQCVQGRCTTPGLRSSPFSSLAWLALPPAQGLKHITSWRAVRGPRATDRGTSSQASQATPHCCSPRPSLFWGSITSWADRAIRAPRAKSSAGTARSSTNGSPTKGSKRAPRRSTSSWQSGWSTTSSPGRTGHWTYGLQAKSISQAGCSTRTSPDSSTRSPTNTKYAASASFNTPRTAPHTPARRQHTSSRWRARRPSRAAR